MKYGMRERISGAIIVVALAVIFVPMLFDEPDSENPRPDPVLTIEPPVTVEQHAVPAPAPPDGLGEIIQPQTREQREQALAEAESQARGSLQPENPEPTEGPEPDTAAENTRQAPREDPLAAIAAAAERRLAESRSSAASTASSTSSSSTQPAASASGEWEVQVGSFGNPANAQGMVRRLQQQGFNAYSRPRDDALISVYAGPYATSEQAETARAQIKSSVNQNGMVKRVAP